MALTISIALRKLFTYMCIGIKLYIKVVHISLGGEGFHIKIEYGIAVYKRGMFLVPLLITHYQSLTT